MEKAHRRVNVVIHEDQYQALTERGLNLSGLIRDLLGDYLSQSAITIQVSEETRKIYDLIVANTGAEDVDIELYLRRALAEVRQRGLLVTDDTAACELIGQSVQLVRGTSPNPKVTVPADLPYVELLLRTMV